MKTTRYTSPVLGEVTLATLKMSQRFDITGTSGDNDTLLVAKMLAASVVGKDGKPLKTVDEWDDYGGENFADAMAMFSAVMQLNDIKGTAAEKK